MTYFKKIKDKYIYLWRNKTTLRDFRSAKYTYMDLFPELGKGITALLGIIFFWPLVFIAMCFKWTIRLWMEPFQRDDRYFEKLDSLNKHCSVESK